MRWERLFDDLEAQLEAEERTAAEGEIADLVRAERARLAVVDRLKAHLGEPLTWALVTGEPALTGRLLDVGADWVLVATASGESLIPIGAVQSITGLSRFTAPEAGEVARRLGIGVILRGLSRDRAVVGIRLKGDQRVTGTIDRVGVDHCDLAVHPEDEPRRERAVREVRCVLLPAIVGVSVR
ncbi:MAG TPA: hypothetical protein VLL08_32445 [Kineosporiaceae bacterium]|nr:hypothetical protein [Kineosporiaceae bacterium]